MKLRLDDAIDQVAARLTQVDDDPMLASRIVAALPERPGSFPFAWVARFAMGALAALALAVFLRSFYEDSTDVLRRFYGGSTAVLQTTSAKAAATEPGTLVEPPSNTRRTSVEPASNDRRTSVEPSSNLLRTSVEPSSNARRTPVEPASNDRRPPVDHEFALPAIESVAALDIGSLGPVALPVEDALVIAPLAIADLPLTADFPEKEE